MCSSLFYSFTNHGFFIFIATTMTGALRYKNLTVKEVMTPVERVFMLSVDDKLSFETVAQIFKTGFSRIPIYEVHKVGNYPTGVWLACLLGSRRLTPEF
jgi:Mg2+/Co2+ transporter CorC